MDTHTLPAEPDVLRREEIEAFRAMTPAERGRRLAVACRAAARLRRSRLKAGLPEAQPDPWPESTWEFLAKHAAHVRSR